VSPGLHPPSPAATLQSTSTFGRSLRLWLPVALWMSLMILASTDLMANRRTSRILGPLLRWVMPGIREATIERVQWVVRKSMHVTEYGILALLVLRARTRTVRWLPREWSWGHGLFVVGVCGLFAVSDEVHQALVPSRHGSVLDVGLDTLSAAIALALLRIIRRMPRSAAWPQPKP